MGHLLYKLNVINKQVIHKFEKESVQLGKASFHFAWVMDENEEERERGVTINVAKNHFQTDNYDFTILDAPGH